MSGVNALRPQTNSQMRIGRIDVVKLNASSSCQEPMEKGE